MGAGGPGTGILFGGYFAFQGIGQQLAHQLAHLHGGAEQG
jgi:hypothetical protein